MRSNKTPTRILSRLLGPGSVLERSTGRVQKRRYVCNGKRQAGALTIVLRGELQMERASLVMNSDVYGLYLTDGQDLTASSSQGRVIERADIRYDLLEPVEWQRQGFAVPLDSK